MFFALVRALFFCSLLTNSQSHNATLLSHRNATATMNDAATAFFLKRIKQHARAEKERKRLTREEKKARKREERIRRERVAGLFDGEAVEVDTEDESDGIEAEEGFEAHREEVLAREEAKRKKGKASKKRGKSVKASKRNKKVKSG